MIITDYRVQSVLRAYTQQLQRSKLAVTTGRTAGGETSEKRVSLSEAGRRRLMMDRLTTQILEKMYPQQEEETGTPRKESETENGPAMEKNQ